MPGFSLPPPPPPPAANTGAMAYPPGFQYELQTRDHHIHNLQLDNVRLQVQLEQAEKDVKTAMEAMMVALRSGGTKQVHSPAMGNKVPRIVKEMADTSVLRGWTQSNRSGGNDGWGNGSSPENISRSPEESLLDLENSEGDKSDEGWTSKSKTPVDNFGRSVSSPHHPLLSPFHTPEKVVEHDPFASTRVSEDLVGVGELSERPNKPRFKRLFASPEVKETPENHNDRVMCWPSVLEETPEYLARHTKRKTPPGWPQTQVRGPIQVAEAEAKSAGDCCDQQQLAARLPQNEKQVPPDTSFSNWNNFPADNLSDERAGGSKNTHAHRESSDSDQIYFSNAPSRPAHASYGFRRHGSPRPAARRAHRDDNDDHLPLYWRYGIIYLPGESEKNVYRTVVIYNLPPQTDVADILSRAGDAPVLSIKLLPTIGMKGRKEDGSIGVLNTMTALMTFFLETSAEQFVFDVAEEPLAIRGRLAIAKLLDKPTFPSRLEANTFQCPPGRVFSRRIKFQRPGLLPADQFDDALTWRTYGFRTQGWIVNKTVKKEGGKNMVTVEFASVDSARWAYKRIDGDNSNFQGCRPQWVYDHQDGGDTNDQNLLKTRDDGESSDGEVFGGPGFSAVAGVGVPSTALEVPSNRLLT